MKVKRLVMHGFKSFAKKTDLEFTPGINVILGPNGSGKSNVSDALCFVLGRLSIKSMRAAKASNLIFLGTKSASPAKEAVVEIVFENEDRTFSIDSDEVSIKRIVRKNGQSIYKINHETKTRQDILVLLAEAGVDPNGYNIILQGEIQNLVRMNNEERRKIIEEVSGISIYEMRKQKSLKELEKTDEKLKEILAILRERTSYLNNLEKERQQALKFKKLESDAKTFKASIIFFDISKKKKEIERIKEEISKKNLSIEKIKKQIQEIQTSILNLESKIKSINQTIQQSTGFEQEKLNKEISELRAEIAGFTVRKENFQSKINSLKKQKIDLEESVRENELSVKELKKESPGAAKEADLEKKKKELETLESMRKKYYFSRSELKSIQDRIQDKISSQKMYQNESEIIVKQIANLSSEMFDKKTTHEKVNELKGILHQKRLSIESFYSEQKELEKTIYAAEYEINKLKKVEDEISKLDVCPLCKSKITEDHIKSIRSESRPQIDEFSTKINYSKNKLKDLENKIEKTKEEINKLTEEIPKRESDLNKMSNVEEKSKRIKQLEELKISVKKDINELSKKLSELEEYVAENANIEQKYETVKIEVQEISLRNQENIDSEISFKIRELDRSKISLKQLNREIDELSENLNDISKKLEDRDDELEEKIQQEEELTKKFKMLIAERDYLQDKIRENETSRLMKQNEIHRIEQEENNLKIEKARIDAEFENLETEMLSYPNIEPIKTNNRDNLIEKLSKTQEVLANIGNVNLRSLEVYDSVKQEYDSIKEKTEVIEKEKHGILKIIHEIDIKKKKTFLQTLNSLNDIFSRNFAQLSTKGQVYLELEDKREPFQGGVTIVVKTGHGKYFDVTSLSGGEQTLVALSLIFAIQEHKPYPFYILDEIDAALDKRNSQRLAELLKKYMQNGQYIVITHNDEVITNASSIYGVSMHDGVSKLLSMKL